jgi:hypothetical protein
MFRAIVIVSWSTDRVMSHQISSLFCVDPKG